MKRLLDITVALIGLIVTYPLFVILDLINCPAIYQGLRMGKNCKPFYMMKFRTMVIDAESLGGPNTAQDDNRLTKLGKFLKKYKIDEIPQLINVLLGEMSLVGPRPEVPQYCLLHPSENVIFKIKPGMTDWASLWDIHEEETLKGCANPETEYLAWIRPTKVAMQKWYARNHRFGMDLSILMMTFKKVIC
jgi:lipopolysaccharide/colanic/teichoic acid biosynthesis glycosyltransferase